MITFVFEYRHETITVTMWLPYPYKKRKDIVTEINVSSSLLSIRKHKISMRPKCQEADKLESRDDIHE